MSLFKHALGKQTHKPARDADFIYLKRTFDISFTFTSLPLTVM